MTPTVSVVIVTFHTRDLLRACLDSLPAGFGGLPYDVWVVDNASSDGTAEMMRADYPQVHYIYNQKNLGFAKANNQALLRSEAPYSLLLNSDAELRPGCAESLYRFLQAHPQAAMVGPRLVHANGDFQRSAYHLPSVWTQALDKLKLYKLLPRKMAAAALLGSHWNHDETRCVGRLTGACILFRSSDFRGVGFLPEEFFFYGEVHDVCWRLWKAGRETWFLSEAEALHHGGSTSKKSWDYRERRRRMWRANELLLTRNMSLLSARLTFLLGWLGLKISWLAGGHLRTSNNRDLLAVDMHWHDSRLKEWFRFRLRAIRKIYFERPAYFQAFRKRLEPVLRKALPDAPELEAEVQAITLELNKSWNAAPKTSGKSGLFDVTGGGLLYEIIRAQKPKIVVETGVANGLSTAMILAAMQANGAGTLYSIDWFESEETSFVLPGRKPGWVIPDRLHHRWDFQFGRSEELLAPLLQRLGEIDIFLHDSDHSYESMLFEFKTSWPHIRNGGLLLTDDARLSDAFNEFTWDHELPHVVFKERLGVARKLRD